MKKQEKKDFAHYVLKAQSDNKMVFNLRNIKNSNIYKFFDKFEDRLGVVEKGVEFNLKYSCLLYTSPSPRDKRQSRMPSSA